MARPKKFDEAIVLQKALNIFWQKGYAGTSMADLVAAMQINAPSLYDTYGDKRHLFLAALANYQQSQQQYIEHLVTSSRSVKETIRQLLTEMAEETLQDPDRKGCFVVNTITELANQDQEVFQMVNENGQVMQGLLLELLQKGQEVGQIAPDKKPAVLANYLLTFIQGLRIQTIANPDRALLDETIETVLSLL